jgi:aryl-alcohol dehydrogenase-like predicted oxidoreductase
MMPTLQHFGVGCIPWSPLAGGRKLLFKDRKVSWHPDLARPHDRDAGTERSQSGGLPVSKAAKAVIGKVETIAKKRNISMAQVALAWSLSKPFITAPIVGTTSLDKLDDLIKGCEVELSAEEIKEIDEEYKTQSVIGHN